MSAKTHKGLQKRLKKSATGKVLRRACGKRHSMSKKRARRVRRLTGWRGFSKGDLRAIERQYGKIR
jgi:ribosomal protein L35